LKLKQRSQGFRPAFAVPIYTWIVACATLGSRKRACLIFHILSSKRTYTLNKSTNRLVGGKACPATMKKPSDTESSSSLKHGISTTHPLYVRQAVQVRWIGLVGLIIIWLDVLIFPVLQGSISSLAPALTPPAFLYIIGPLTIIGTLFFGIMTKRAGVFPGWLGFCLFVRYLGDTSFSAKQTLTFHTLHYENENHNVSGRSRDRNAQ